jgi:PDZ domain-containing protein
MSVDDIDNSDKDETDENMSENSVPLPPQRTPSSQRALYWALPMVTITWCVLFSFIAFAVVRISRWELAPGEASAVASRIQFTAPANGDLPQRYKSENSIEFVTALGGQLSILDSVLGWIDPYVTVQTERERFGDQSPSSIRRLGFQAMYSAKQIAEYVALKRLGLDAQLIDGAVIVEQVICDNAPKENPACKVLDVGETIVSFNGAKVPTLTALADQMKSVKVGDVVTLSVIPYDVKATKPDPAKAVTRTVTMMESPDTPGRPIIGFVPADTRTVKLPFEVDIATTDIGGPSAGLAFTLALLDELTPGNLMGDQRVAATGTIREDGSVGAIGALVQKAVAVRESGARVFLVPRGQTDSEIADAQKAAGNRVQVVPVATLDEALKALTQRGGDPLPATLTEAENA